MINHRLNLKNDGWTIIKSKNISDIEILSKNFLQELKKSKILNLKIENINFLMDITCFNLPRTVIADSDIG